MSGRRPEQIQVAGCKHQSVEQLGQQRDALGRPVVVDHIYECHDAQ